MISVNTNVAAINAGRQLGKTQFGLSKTFEKLSSGLRINRAADDAGGLKIGQRLTAQIKGIGQAMRNANDGISLVQTAEGALDESSNILQRLRELSVQATNDTYTTSDRESLQDEANALISDLNRIAENTTFNGQSLLDGGFTNKKLHVGADSEQTITVSLNSARADDLGHIVRQDSTSNVATDETTDGLQINGVQVKDSALYASASGDGRSSTSAYAKARAINATGAGVKAVALETTITDSSTTAFSTSTTDAALNINGVDIYSGDGVSKTVSQVISDVNDRSGDTGVTASAATGGGITLTAEDGRDIIITNSGTTAGVLSSDSTTSGKIRLISSEDVEIVDSNTDSIGFAAGLLSIDTANTVSGIDLTTHAGAEEAIDRLDGALGTVSTRRGELGAVQNRLETAISNLANVSENLNSARSRIMDVDFATETVSMTKGLMMQQAGASVLAQAKASSQFALSLLQ